MPTFVAHAGAADESLAVVMVFAALWTGWIGWSRIRGTAFPRLPRNAGFALLAVGAVLLVSAGVVPQRLLGPATAPSGPDAANRVAPTSTARLTIISPLDGAVITDDQLEVVIQLEDGRVIEGASTELSPDEGHVHLSVDGELLSMTYGTVQVVDVRTMPAGEHVLEAEFVAADHGPFSPPVTARVSFTTGDAG